MPSYTVYQLIISFVLSQQLSPFIYLTNHKVRYVKYQLIDYSHEWHKQGVLLALFEDPNQAIFF